jgi:hypothetical protein
MTDIQTKTVEVIKANVTTQQGGKLVYEATEPNWHVMHFEAKGRVIGCTVDACGKCTRFEVR